MAQALFVFGFILSPALLLIYLEQQARFSAIEEFRSSRQVIMHRIEAAVEHRDLGTLRSIDKKYAAFVRDRGFKESLQQALAKVTATETEMELAASRSLHLERHTREVSIRPDLMKPQIPDGENVQQRLSVLPQ